MMERPFARIWILLPLAVALQLTVLASFQVAQVRLDAFFLCTVSVALLTPWRLATVFGLAAGLLDGVLVGTNLGSFAAALMVVGALVALSERFLSRETPFAPSVNAFFGALLMHAILLLVSPTDFPLSWLVRHALLMAFTHALFILPLHYFVEHSLLPARRRFFAS